MATRPRSHMTTRTVPARRLISGITDRDTREGTAERLRALDLSGFQRLGNISLAVEDAPNVDVLGTLHIEHDLWIAPERPGAEARDLQLVRISRRPARRRACNVAVRPLERRDEPAGGSGGSPRWTPQIRPLVDTSKPAIRPGVSETW